MGGELTGTGGAVVVGCEVWDTGYCLVSEHHMIAGGRRAQVACHALVGVIRHPREGWILWDAGYAPRMYAASARWPFWLYRVATPLFIRPALTVAAQLQARGVDPGAVRWVVISHFHADHVGGLLDFPGARLVATAAGYGDVVGRRGWGALRRAVLPDLLPTDFADRATLLPEPFTGPGLPGLGPTHDLFGDGSLLLVSLPGHARGQVGMLVHSDRGRLLLAADGAWLSRAIRERRGPHPITRFFVDDPAAIVETLARLHTFMQACPDVRIVPTHCPEAYAREVQPWTLGVG